MQAWYKKIENHLLLSVYVQPGAKQTEHCGLHGGALKIRLAASPIDGQANKALLMYLSRLFEVPVRQIHIKRGMKSRFKQILIQGSLIHPEDLMDEK